MGVVYSSKEIASGAIPQNGAHLEAAQEIFKRISKLDIVKLIVVYGSIYEGKSNVRSDLDILATYDAHSLNEEYETIVALKTIFDDVEGRMHVKNEPNIWPANEPIEVRMQRSYDFLFYQHLDEAMKNSRWTAGERDKKIELLANTNLGGETLKLAVLAYLAYKHKGITIAPPNFDESPDSLKSLQRTLELPKALGRKVRQISFKESFLEGMAEPLGRLGAIDREYTEYMEEIALQINELQQRDIDEYGGWLADRYKQAMPLALAALRGFTEEIASEEELLLVQ